MLAQAAETPITAAPEPTEIDFSNLPPAPSGPMINLPPPKPQEDAFTAEEITRIATQIRTFTSNITGDALEEKVRLAAAFPLGSEQNPVRAEGPHGQHAYLRRLQCDDGTAPSFVRRKKPNISTMQTYLNPMDRYEVRCEGSAPEMQEVFMDMYHRGHVELRPVPGFSIAPPPPEPEP